MIINSLCLQKNVHQFILLVVAFLLIYNVSYSQQKEIKFEVSIAEGLIKESVTGRLFLLVSTDSIPEPRLQRRPSPLIFGVDISNCNPGDEIIINNNIPGYPVKKLSDFPAGEYYVQALLNVYTEFHRSDGHTIRAHMDHWEGQKFTISPGNLVSRVRKVKLDPASSLDVKILLEEEIPPVKMPDDTEWIKHIKIKSELLSEFWGHPFYLGATVLLPKGYNNNQETYYPVEYQQGHFTLAPPYDFSPDFQPESDSDRERRLRNYDETGYEFYSEWVSENFPRMICVTFQHPTPFYDDSYAVNSANNGPYGEAIITELIPYIEQKFRIIREPYARVLSGGSTGGWEALALQVYHPDFFGGAFIFFPDPVDFRSYGLLDIYKDDNAFFIKNGMWSKAERPMNRDIYGQPVKTLREQSFYESVLGSRGRSCEQLNIWEAVYGPVGKDGYPRPLWDPVTGEIDDTTALYMRDHNYDLRYYMESNWGTLGEKLQGKLHFYCGDMDNLYLNLGVYRMEQFLQNTKNPYYDGTFEYGRPMKGHGWKPFSNAELIKLEAAHILKNTPGKK